jgi:hypothetical protein
VNIPVPEKPALADENSVEGLEAFTKWWFELLNYAYATNDLEPLWAVTDEGCTTCQNIQESIAKVYANGGWMSGGSVRVDTFDSKFRENTHGSIDSFITNVQEPITVYDRHGEVLAESAEESEPVVYATTAQHLNGEWIMADYGEINTGK